MIDAEALRLIASDPELDGLMQYRKEETACILTPHLAEFADLAHVSVKEAAADRTSLLKKNLRQIQLHCHRQGCKNSDRVRGNRADQYDNQGQQRDGNSRLR